MSKGLNADRTIEDVEVDTRQLESSYSRLDVVKRILESSYKSNRSLEPRLMSGSQMSYLQIDEYIAPMLSSGLLRYDQESRAYRITAKGIDFLSSIRQIDYFIKTIEE